MSISSSTPQKKAKRSTRHRAREFAVQGLYQWKISGNSNADINAHLQSLEGFSRADQNLCFELLNGVITHHQELNLQITQSLDRPLDQLSPIEHSILLIASLELSRHKETPQRVVINEGIELAKTFGNTDSYKYINGVLDKLAPIWRTEEKHEEAE